jgi:hypothetical protein
VRYLKEGIKEGNPFLSMHEFGPFVMQNMGHMKVFGEIILAFTLQMSSLHRQRLGQVVEESGSTGGLSHVGIHSTSGDPQTLVRPLSELTVSEPLTPTTTKGPQHSSRFRSSMQRIFGTPRAKPSRSTNDDSEHPEERRRRR